VLALEAHLVAAEEEVLAYSWKHLMPILRHPFPLPETMCSIGHMLRCPKERQIKPH
jgi:hypothetical protein